jgi:hypothetical protein
MKKGEGMAYSYINIVKPCTGLQSGAQTVDEGESAVTSHRHRPVYLRRVYEKALMTAEWRISVHAMSEQKKSCWLLPKVKIHGLTEACDMPVVETLKRIMARERLGPRYFLLILI